MDRYFRMLTPYLSIFLPFQCNGCPTVTNRFRPNFLAGKSWTKRDVVFDDVDIPDAPYVQKDIPGLLLTRSMLREYHYVDVYLKEKNLPTIMSSSGEMTTERVGRP